MRLFAEESGGIGNEKLASIGLVWIYPLDFMKLSPIPLLSGILYGLLPFTLFAQETLPVSEPAQIEQAQIEPVQIDPAPIESDQIEPGQVELGQKVYFEWHENGAVFDGQAEGRAYTTVGSSVFAIGGRDAAGKLLDEVQILQRDENGDYEVHHAKLSQPVAFAGVTAQDGKIYLAGGLSPEGITDRVIELEWVDGALTESELLPLPEPLMLAGVTTHRSTVYRYLYVVGGLTALNAEQASDVVYELPIAQGDGIEIQWSEATVMPFGGRIAPVVYETYNEVVVLGGYRMEPGQKLVPTNTTWGYSRIPRDGHVHAGWEERADFYTSIAAPAASKTGQSHLTLVGGNQASGTLPQLIGGSFPQDLLDGVWAFHDPTDTWNQIGQSSIPASGGALLQINGESYLWVDAADAQGEVVPAVAMDFLRTTKTVSWIDWTVIGLYFAVVAWIGYIFARKNKDASTFALGNRNVKWWASSISMMATGVSTISFMAIPALVACIGMATTGPVIFMLFGVVMSAFLTYPLLRRLKITSTYEYVEQRFGLGLRLFGSFNSIIVQMMGRIGIVVMLPALAISTMTGIDPWISILTMGFVTTIYSTAGGFEAVIWTDVVQGVLMIAGFAAIGVLAYAGINGGLGTFIDYGRSMDRFNFFITEWDVRIPMIWFAIFGFIIQFMAFASDQATAQRVLSIPIKDVRKLAFLSGGFGMGIAYMAAAVGMGLFAFFKSNPEVLSPVMKNDQMVPLFIVSQVPVGVSGLLLATLFAASMSTISSSVNVCAVLFGEDFYKRFRKNASSKEEMRVMQVISLLSGAIGTGMALWLLSMDMPTLWESFMRIMAYVGGGYVGVFILGMFTRRTHELGAICGVLVSFGMAYYINNAHFSVHWSALSVFVVMSCIITGYVFSLVIPWKRKDLTGLTIWDQVPDLVTDEELIAKQEAAATSSD